LVLPLSPRLSAVGTLHMRNALSCAPSGGALGRVEADLRPAPWAANEGSRTPVHQLLLEPSSCSLPSAQDLDDDPGHLRVLALPVRVTTTPTRSTRAARRERRGARAGLRPGVGTSSTDADHRHVSKDEYPTDVQLGFRAARRSASDAWSAGPARGGDTIFAKLYTPMTGCPTR
jgi:hypothetical protein